MTPLPTSLAAAPTISAAVPATPSSSPAETAPGDGKTATMDFLDQLAKLLQSTALTNQSPAPETSGTPPGSTAASPTQPNGIPGIAGAQAQIALPQLPVVAPPTKQPETQSIQPRSLGVSKSKTESAAQARRPSENSDQSTAAALAVLPALDAIATPPVLPPATRDGTAPHEPAQDQHRSLSPTSGTDQPASSALKLDGPDPGVAGLNLQQPPEASPMQTAPAQPPADALATAMQPAAPQTAAPSVRPTETTSATASAPSPHHGSPAAQITPALMQIGQAPDGAQRLTVRLDPPELGHVQVKIDRASDASARVEITVEKQETLTLLLRDQPQLQRALDQAGVPTDGRTVTFHIAAPTSVVRTDAGTTPVPSTNAGGLTGDGSHGATREQGQFAHRRHGTTDDDGAETTPLAARSWLRAGLDITA